MSSFSFPFSGQCELTCYLVETHVSDETEGRDGGGEVGADLEAFSHGVGQRSGKRRRRVDEKERLRADRDQSIRREVFDGRDALWDLNS